MLVSTGSLFRPAHRPKSASAYWENALYARVPDLEDRNNARNDRNASVGIDIVDIWMAPPTSSKLKVAWGTYQNSVKEMQTPRSFNGSVRHILKEKRACLFYYLPLAFSRVRLCKNSMV